MEELYSLDEVKIILNLPRKRAERLFENVPGVIRDMPPGYKRPGLTVPRAALLAVLRGAEVRHRDCPAFDWSKWLDGPRLLHTIPALGADLKTGETRARHLFQHEAGVLRLSAPGDVRPAIRVPEDVLQRVIRRSLVPEPVPGRQM